MERVAARSHAADRRAALVAATICNANPFRKKGARLVQIDDFIRGPTQYMSVAEGRAALNAWAGSINRERKKKRKRDEKSI